MTDYEAAYTQCRDYFGGPSPLLVHFAERIHPGGRVLDIGVGQGRNALHLAKLGFRVTGIDPSPAAVQAVADRAQAEGVAIDLHPVGFDRFEPTAGPFDAVLLFGLLQDLPRGDWAALLGLLHRWTAPRGLLLVTAWHVGDPRYGEIAQRWVPIGVHSFREPDGDRTRSFLGAGEIVELLVGWKLIHHEEGLGPEHRHGDGPLERHGVVEVVAERA